MSEISRIFASDYENQSPTHNKCAVSRHCDDDSISPLQQDLFDVNAEQIEKMRRLDEVVDRINRMQGSETIVIGAQQYTRKDGKGKANVFANAIKHDFRSPNPTTRWSDIIKLK